VTSTKHINKKLTFITSPPIKKLIFSLLGMIVISLQGINLSLAGESPLMEKPKYDRQWYIGGGSGLSDPLFEDIDNGIRLDAYTGIEVSEQVAVEAGVIHLGEFDSSANNSLDINGVTMALRGINRISPFSSLYMKLGVLAWRVEPTLFLNNTQLTTSTESGQSLWLGFGLALHFGRHFTIWSGADHFSQVDNVDINSYSGGVQFSF